MKNYAVNENNVIATHYHQNVKLNPKQNTECSYFSLIINPIILICAIARFISCFEDWFSEAVLALRLDEMGLNEFLIGLYYWIYGVSCIISTFMVSYFTDKYEISGIIWKSMLLWGFTCFLIGPSEYLPNSIVLMGIGETLNGLLLAFFITTWLPVMIEEGERMHPHRKL